MDLHTIDVQVPRDALIRLYLDVTTRLMAEAPVLRVPLADLASWAKYMHVEDVSLLLRADGRVEVTLLKFMGDIGHLIVLSIADLVRDLELPPTGRRESVRLPVAELSRLESFSQPAVKAVA